MTEEKREYIKFCNTLLINDEIFYRKFNDKIELYAYGCPDSIWDLEVIASGIDSEKLEEPIIFIDTCAAIDKQEAVSKRVVDRLTKIYSDRKIFITGCGVNYESNYYKDKGICFNNQEKFKLENYNLPLKDNYKFTQANHESGFIKISDGCDLNCSYCAIKNFRPKYMMSYNEIATQIERSIAAGNTDICLFGTEICSYNYRDIDLVSLIETILSDFIWITSIKLDSINPGYKRINELIKLIKEEPLMQKELDLAIQSCSDSILRRMHRPYTVEQIKNVVKQCNGLDIQFQLITGFPGETDEEFNKSLEVIKELAPNRITLCPFSARVDTEAYTMDNQVPHEIAEKREQKLVEVVSNETNQEIEKEGLREFNKFKKYGNNTNTLYFIPKENLISDLYDTENFVNLFKTLEDFEKQSKYEWFDLNSIKFDPNKEIGDLSTNLKLLILRFGARPYITININDETIKINYPRLLTNDITTFVSFKFEDLETATEDEVVNFFKMVLDCKLSQYWWLEMNFGELNKQKYGKILKEKLEPIIHDKKESGISFYDI